MPNVIQQNDIKLYDSLLSVIPLNVVMLNVNGMAFCRKAFSTIELNLNCIDQKDIIIFNVCQSAERHSSECHSSECRSSECHSSECHSFECHSSECHSSECHSSECHSSERHSSECHSSECHSSECHSSDCIHLNGIRLNVFFQTVTEHANKRINILK